ncbi:MAG: hypothetical protein K1X67_22585 [Fimbriimonadaceae bacterium]|nr:hypothetical protein [Fimbriimonadaceae bacterium]
MKNTLILAALCTCGISQASASFVGLGDFNGGIFENRCWDLSSDGQWVVGGGVGIAGPTAYRWSLQSGLIPMGDLPGGGWDSEAKGVSADGSVICGQGLTANGSRGWRWTQATGLVQLADLPGGSAWTWPTGISDDGTVIVGNADDDTGQVSTRWVNGQAYSLGNLDYNSNWAQSAHAVNGDGSVIVGFSGIADVGLAFKWTPDLGMVPVHNAPGERAVHAYDVTADGSMIVGWGSQGDGYVHSYRWSTEMGFEWLPGVSTLAAISDDGRFMGGTSFSTPGLEGDEAAVFDPLFGWRRLRTILVDNGAFGFANWKLENIQDLTVVGQEIIVCGNGKNPNGEVEAFYARFPVPHQFVGGQCVLEDVESMLAQVIWIEVREEGSLEPLATYPAVLDAVGRFRVETAHMAGTYSIAIKAGHHLRKTQSVALTGDGASMQLSLTNGDVDGDNEIGIADYARLSASFGIDKGQPGYDDVADLNIDSTVDIADYSILSANYGMIGDD